MIDFDDIDSWAPKLAAALQPWIPESAERSVAAAAPSYIEDALDALLHVTSPAALIDAALAWIQSITLMGYHGSRLTDEEIASIRSVGLLPLKAKARRPRLISALSKHCRWGEVAEQLDATLDAHGRGNAAGYRENQVHLTLSKSGLIQGFNHYLTHGAEFDQHVAYSLLGAEGTRLLAEYGRPTVMHVAVPGAVALESAHPYFSVDDMLRKGETPNIVRQFLEAWSYRLLHPEFQVRSLRVDCGMIFRCTVPPSWIVACETMA